MKFPKIIPLWLFRTVGITMLVISLLVTFYFIVTDSGPYAFFADLLTDERNTYPPALAFLLTFLLVLIPFLMISLILRPFSNVPSFRTQMTDMGPFTTKFKTTADVSVYGELPSVFSRILAFIIDRFIVVLAIAIPGGVFAAVIEETHSRGAIYFIMLGIFIIFAVAAVVYSYSRDMFGGKSLARRLLKQRVVDVATGKPIGGWRSFKREVLIHFAPLIIIELILISSNKDRRRMGDNWAKSIVVKDLPNPGETFN